MLAVSESFDDIKVGDQFILPNTPWTLKNGGQVLTVERVTKTQFASGDMRFFKRNGEKLGNGRLGYSRGPKVARFTPERAALLDKASRVLKARKAIKDKLLSIELAVGRLKANEQIATGVSAAHLEEIARYLQSAVAYINAKAL